MAPDRTLALKLVTDSKGLDRLNSTIKKLAVGVGAVFATDKILDFGKAAVTMADDVDQAEGKLKQLLGRHAQSVKAFAKNSKAIGISRRDTLKYTSSLAALMRVQGANQREAAKSSIRWTKLAADMAAFNNASPEEVLIGMQSALSGEFEPLKRMGVLLSATKVRQEAYRMGIAKTGKALTDRQKLLATESLLMKQTKLQQGQLARESGTLGAKVNNLNAIFADFQLMIGEALLPVVTDFVTFLTGTAVPAIADLGAKVGLIDVQGILDAIANMDFGALATKVNDALNTLALDPATLEMAGKVGIAIAGAMFLGSLFIDAAKLAFSLPGWAAKGAVGLAVSTVGATLGGIFTLAMWTGKEAIGLLSGGAAYAFRQLGLKNSAVWLAASGLGGGLGGVFIGAFGAALVGIAAKNLILDKLAELFASVGVPADVLKEARKSADFGSPLSMIENLIKNLVPGHATGLASVPYDGYLARLHKGERVVPASQNKGGGMGSNYSISVYVAPGGDLVEAGRQTVRAIQEYEKRGGKSWRN
jgi:hypothetical protein